MTFAEHFASTKSRANFEHVSNRLRKAKVIDSEVNDFLRDRLAVEERYIAELARLSKKTINVEKDELGGFNEAWNKILTLTSATAESHRAFCSEVGDCMDKLNKEYEDELKKLKRMDSDGKGISFFKKLKAREGSGNSENMASMQKAGENYVAKLRPLLEKFQAFDESRLEALLDTFKTLTRSELGIHSKMINTSTLVSDVLEALNITDEIEAFCRKKGTNQESFSVAYDSTDASSSRKDSVVTSVGSAPPTVPVVDAEGFSVPPPSTNIRWPGGRNFDSDEEDNARDQGQPKLRVAIKDSSITDNPESAMQTMQNVVAAMQILPQPQMQSETLHPTSIDFSKAFGEPKYNDGKAPRNNVAVDAVITETINLLLRDGEIEKLMVSGEVAVVVPVTPSVSKCKAFLQGSDSIEKVVVNDMYASQPDAQQQNLIELDLDRISELGGPAPILKYKLHIDSSDYEQYAPVFFSTLWKKDPTYSSFLLAYQYNDDFKARAPLQGLSFLVNLQNGGSIASVQLKPTGIWNPDKKALLWRVEDIRTDDPASVETHKLFARFETSEDLTSAQVIVRFTSPTLCSEIELDFPEDGVLLRNVEKNITTGTYGSF
ncbi:hypothetical protein HDU67_007737 [Dinochytrium kinnereticum]|nr:hypothetical protein HDU67_007737 [Dinochytrium kinnereticum]